ncbi:Single-stranded DNA-binding protein, mitochondrial [Trichoplax sp. H2]|nr:Single-stranded DNA-binding protein, mitochondrial [Trichoplax sp. H2]|eukprot:RDD41141.1 Single-stranded DNA-binding protein, mitochondrial [Trichoplax sp. H2]
MKLRRILLIVAVFIMTTAYCDNVNNAKIIKENRASSITKGGSNNKDLHPIVTKLNGKSLVRSKPPVSRNKKKKISTSLSPSIFMRRDDPLLWILSVYLNQNRPLPPLKPIKLRQDPTDPPPPIYFRQEPTSPPPSPSQEIPIYFRQDNTPPPPSQQVPIYFRQDDSSPALPSPALSPLYFNRPNLPSPYETTLLTPNEFPIPLSREYYSVTSRLIRNEESRRPIRSINHVQLLGNVGNDPVKVDDKSVRFSVATNRSWFVKNEDSGHLTTKTEWHSIFAYKPALQNYIMQTVTKGQRVLLNGRLSYGRFVDSEGRPRSSAYIVLDDLIALSFPKAENEIEEVAEEDSYEA